jgi:hypothetical protein
VSRRLARLLLQAAYRLDPTLRPNVMQGWPPIVVTGSGWLPNTTSTTGPVFYKKLP